MRSIHKASKYHFEDLSQFVAQHQGQQTTTSSQADENNTTVEDVGASGTTLERFNSSATEYDDELFNFGKYIRMRSADDTGKQREKREFNLY